ncbi:MAG TPA: hypothetical protein VF848_03595 [Steroidobacteraceae bacterium]
MLEPHAPHEAIQTWRGFFVHIATIVVGLIIAVGLEQTVEYFHHRHQRNYLEQQMREVLENDIKLIADDTAKLKDFRAYLVELLTAINGRRHALSTPAAPPANDPRSGPALRFPSLAPYEAAKDNGTTALLSNQRIRIFNRIALQRSLMMAVSDHWLDDLAAMNAFKKRFDPAAETTGLEDLQSAADLAGLSLAELTEYQVLIGNLINRTDYLIFRLRVFDVECRTILGGIQDENELIEEVSRAVRTGFRQQ